MWYFWRSISTTPPRGLRSSSNLTTTGERARPREHRSTRRSTAKSRGPDDSPGDRPPDGSPPSVGRRARSGQRVTYQDVSYRLNVALEWHQDDDGEGAWAVVNELRESVDHHLCDEARAAA
jgi:hypothetical protein